MDLDCCFEREKPVYNQIYTMCFDENIEWNVAKTILQFVWNLAFEFLSFSTDPISQRSASSEANSQLVSEIDQCKHACIQPCNSLGWDFPVCVGGQ